VGLFLIVKEGGVAAGVRRIEAFTGPAAFAKLREADREVDALARALKTGRDATLRKVEEMQAETARLQAMIGELRRGGGGGETVVQRGEELLARARDTHNRGEAIEAYRHFEVAVSLMGEYMDSRDKLAEAKFLATLKVVVEPIPSQRSLEISHEFFENKILEFIESMQVNEFVQFYSFAEAQNIGLDQPDQIIQLQFDDFVLGQVYLKEKEIQLSKDSVVLAVIKARNEVNYVDALVLNHPKDKRAEVLKYFQPAPIIASPVLQNEIHTGGNNANVTVCHKIPGSLGKSQTLSIAQSALEHHLDHGDIQGSCDGDAEPTDSKDAGDASQNQQNTTITTTYPTTVTSDKSTATSDKSASSQEKTEQAATTPKQSSDTYQKADLINLRNSPGTVNTVTAQNDTEPNERKVYGTVKATVEVFNK
jgi:hypothetical protein